MIGQKLKAFCFAKDHLHWLDHLCPLAHFLDLPIFVNDKTFEAHIQNFYPQTTPIFVPLRDFTMNFIEKNVDVLISSSQSSLFELTYFTKNLYNKNIRYIYLPHGNSDKGFSSHYIDYLKNQDMSFYYGDHMLDHLKKRKILPTLNNVIRTGNFRWKYFEKFKKFYEDKADKHVYSFFKKKQKTILYAPTWNDFENLGSFYEIAEPLLKNLPKHYNVIIKLHPFLEDLDPAKIYQLIYPFEKLSNVIVLKNYHCIYSILSKTDIYLGDFSSIGYDALSFDIPLFFLNTIQKIYPNNKNFYLYQCGIQIPENAHTKIFDFIDDNYTNNKYNFQEKRKKAFHYCFGKKISQKKLQQDFLRATISF